MRRAFQSLMAFGIVAAVPAAAAAPSASPNPVIPAIPPASSKAVERLKDCAEAARTRVNATDISEAAEALYRADSGSAWQTLFVPSNPSKTGRPPSSHALALSGTDALPPTLDVNGVKYVSNEAMRSTPKPSATCHALFERRYRRLVLQNLDVVATIRELAPTGEWEPSDMASTERRIERRSCTDDDPAAPRLEKALANGFDCAHSSRYRELCAVLETGHLCEYASTRDALRVALAVDLSRRIVDALQETSGATAGAQAHSRDTLSDLLRNLPRDAAAVGPSGVRRLSESLTSAVIRDALDSWAGLPTRRVVAIAIASACAKAEREGEVVLGNCPIRDLAKRFMSEQAAPLARHLLAARPRPGDSEAVSLGRFEQALSMAVLALSDKPEASALDEKLRAVNRAIMSSDHNAIFALALKELEEEKAPALTRAAMRSVALSSTRSLSTARAEQLGLIRPSGGFRWDFGMAARAAGGVQFGNGPGFAGPIALPIGVALQYAASPGLYADLTVLDPGQYISVKSFDDKSRFRSPGGLDAVAPSLSLGIRWGGSVPLVFAANAGAARLGAEDPIVFVSGSIGTFFSIVPLTRGTDE